MSSGPGLCVSKEEDDKISARPSEGVRMRARIFTAVAGGFLVLAGIAGCAATDGQGETDPVGVVTVPANPDADSMAASAEGTLVYIDGCVRLDSGLVPVFSEDAVTWDGTTLTWRDEDYVIGQKISFGGGEAPADRVDELLPDACGDGPAWIVGEDGYSELARMSVS
jgi:hypothetical protein